MNGKMKKDKESIDVFIGTRSRQLVVRIILLAVVVSAAAIGGTYAFLTVNTAPSANNFSIGIPAVIVNEPSVNSAAVVWGEDTKPVTLSIPADSAGGAVRAAVVPMFKDASGSIVSASSGVISEPADNKMIMGDITLYFADGWDVHWFYKDGFFYYKKVLNPGETTTQLLAGVTLTNNTPEMTAKYQKIVVEIVIMADVIEVQKTAPANWGITVDSSGNVS